MRGDDVNQSEVKNDRAIGEPGQGTLRSAAPSKEIAMDPLRAVPLSPNPAHRANDDAARPSLFSDDGEPWVPVPRSVLLLPTIAVETWAAVYRLANGRTEFPHSGRKLAALMRRSRRTGQLGLLALEGVGLVERRGSGRFLALVIRARLATQPDPGEFCNWDREGGDA
jgi:hypothetical protein